MHTHTHTHVLHTHIVVQVADQFEMPVGSLSVDDAISLLGHEQAERETEVRLQQRLSQSVGRLLGVSNLAEVSSLYRWTNKFEVLYLTLFLANLPTQAQCG